MQPYSLQGKVAIVTGASRKIGIGAAIARELGRGGADVFTTYYRPYDAEQPWGNRTQEAGELLVELRVLGVRAAGLELDLSQADCASKLFEAVEASLGTASILVNNATCSENGGWHEVSAAQLDRHYAVNLRGMTLLCAEFTRRCPPGGGRIINLTSGQGVGAMPDELAYIATKGGVEALTLSLSPALMKMGITINAIDPGATGTGWMSAKLMRDLVKHSPAGRVGTPQDAAHLARFLASDEAGWITGQVIHSRGGM
jgi:3-oxoacyl-[acyl-carrier protein] reductase